MYLRNEGKKRLIDPSTQIKSTLNRKDLITIMKYCVSPAQKHADHLDFILSLLFDFKSFVRFGTFKTFTLRHIDYIEEEEFNDEYVDYLSLVVQFGREKDNKHGHAYPAACYRDVNHLICAQFFYATEFI